MSTGRPNTKAILIPRWTEGSVLLLISAILLLAVACAPAATARGYPPLDPFWRWTPYLACLPVLLLPLFDDDPVRRRALRWIYAIVATIGFGAVMDHGVVPRFNDPLVTLLSALFLAPITIPAIMACEVGANWLWGRVRGFSDDPAHAGGPRFRFNLLTMFGGVAMVAAVLALFQFAATRPASWREVHHQSRNHLSTIVAALDEYRRIHGEFPHDPRGPEHALYALRDLVNASVFDDAPRKAQQAHWDHDAQQLLNGDFAYLNEPAAAEGVVLLVSRRGSPSGYVMVATHLYGFVRRIYLPEVDPGRLLGSYYDGNLLLVNDAAVIADYQQTHPLTFTTQTSSSTSSGGSTVTDVTYSNGVTMQFVTSEHDRPVSCTIRSTTPIVETYELDELGRICAIRRTPENWRLYWQVANPPNPTTTPDTAPSP